MSKVLYIKANPKPDHASYTFKLSEAFVASYKEKNPDDEIITLDLYKEGIKFLDGEALGAMFSGQDTEMKKHAELFASADKFIIAAPMWNLGSPAILKAYFDYVVLVGVTFKYTEQGPVGLLANQGKKAVHIVARGGMYSEGPAAAFEMGDRYVKTILGFMGIEEVSTLSTELTGVLQGADLEASVNRSIEEVKKAAQSF